VHIPFAKCTDHSNEQSGHPKEWQRNAIRLQLHLKVKIPGMVPHPDWHRHRMMADECKAVPRYEDSSEHQNVGDIGKFRNQTFWDMRATPPKTTQCAACQSWQKDSASERVLI
jgi:hypothetical protein